MKPHLILLIVIFMTGLLIWSVMLPTPAALAQGTGTSSGPTLPNPLGENEDHTPISLIDVLLRVLQIALAAVDIFALFMFILGGFQLLISAGNPERIKKAKDTLVWATLGVLVITLSYSILKFIFEAVRKEFGN